MEENNTASIGLSRTVVNTKKIILKLLNSPGLGMKFYKGYNTYLSICRGAMLISSTHVAHYESKYNKNSPSYHWEKLSRTLKKKWKITNLKIISKIARGTIK